MGKGTDKLYITASEWSSSDAFSASAGANVARNGYTSLTSTNTSSNPNISRPRLPYNFCALTLQPVPDDNTAVCTPSGTVFDHAAILNWLAKNSRSKNANGSGSSASSSNPVDPTGPPLRATDLIRLNFTRNDDNEIVDPVTYRPFTQGTRAVTLRPTGNVFARETVERLNVKAKHWQDLISDEPFTRADIIGLQEEQQQDKKEASGSTGKIEKAKEAVARARAERENKNPNGNTTGNSATSSTSSIIQNNKSKSATNTTSTKPRPLPYNAAIHTTGKAAASFTSTGLTPHTSNERAILTDEEYMLRPRRVKAKGYARIATNIGDLSVELTPEYAPKAVWNFVQLAKKGYYKDVVFHRNIRGFMIQTGDPTGTGRGGTSIWNKPFADEFDGPLTHDSRGILSMANKGKNTNTSQFFITYRPAKHLDNKHVVFGKVVAGEGGGGGGGGKSGAAESGSGNGGASFATLARLEQTPTDDKDKPMENLFIRDIVVYVDPFEEFLKGQGQGQGQGQSEKQKQGNRGTMNGTPEEARNYDPVTAGAGAGATASTKRYTDKNDGDDDYNDDDDDSTTTWTGRKLNIRNNYNDDDINGAAGVGKYLKAAKANTVGNGGMERDGENGTSTYKDDMMMMPPSSKKIKSSGGSAGGFGNFDNW